MTMADPINDALVNMKNHEKTAKKECSLRPASKLLNAILKVMKEQGYIEGFEKENDGREGIIKVKLAGKINECKAIKPRYAVKKDGFEKFEKRYLPSRDSGILIVTTPKGVITHKSAKEQKIGGRLLAFVY
jgi:small subunit ribosomal protein S8